MNSTRLLNQGRRIIEELQVDVEIDGQNLTLYNAGIQKGKKRFGLFARDLLLSGFMIGDSEFLKEALKFACLTQGQKRDPQTGEEPGKVIHEYDNVKLRGLKTRYNASDTTQLALIGFSRLLEDGEEGFVKTCGSNIENALDYLYRHISDGIFWEDPSFSGADRFALRSTYWKDDRLPARNHPYYPVAYTLIQAQTVSALRGAGKLLEAVDSGYSSDQPIETAREVVNSINTTFWSEDKGFPIIAKDEKGSIEGISSDGLHMLAYLRPDDLPTDKIKSIAQGARKLQTPYGFRTYGPGQPDYSPNAYHLGSVWPFEQYFIAEGAKDFGQPQVFRESNKVLQALREHGFYELFGWDGTTLTPKGCEKQLWSACLPIGLHRLAS